MPLRVVILGANGFIGSALTAAILRTRDWEVYGIDLSNHKLGELCSSPRFRFVEGDITINREWVEYHIKKSDVVVPLVAIANPAQYVTDPLRVFELDFDCVTEIPEAGHAASVVHRHARQRLGVPAQHRLDEFLVAAMGQLGGAPGA